MGIMLPTDRMRSIAVQAACILVLAVLAAYGAYTVIAETSQVGQYNDSAVVEAATTEALPTSLSDVKSVTEIQDLAAADNTGSTIRSIKLERKDATLAYSVRWSDGSVRYYDAASGMILEETNSGQPSRPSAGIPDGFVTAVSIDQARAIAIERVPLEQVVSISLEVDKGRPVYIVHFSGGSTVTIWAIDGTVAAVEGQIQQDVATPVPAQAPAQAVENAPSANLSDTAAIAKPVQDIEPTPIPTIAPVTEPFLADAELLDDRRTSDTTAESNETLDSTTAITQKQPENPVVE